MHCEYHLRYEDKTSGESSRVAVEDPRPTEIANLFEREGSQVNMASEDVPMYFMRTEVLDSGCEIRIADETDFPGYEVIPTGDSRAGRDFRVAGG